MSSFCKHLVTFTLVFRFSLGILPSLDAKIICVFLQLLPQLRLTISAFTRIRKTGLKFKKHRMESLKMRKSQRNESVPISKNCA